jgi:hypothetical protein
MKITRFDCAKNDKIQHCIERNKLHGGRNIFSIKMILLNESLRIIINELQLLYSPVVTG